MAKVTLVLGWPKLDVVFSDGSIRLGPNNSYFGHASVIIERNDGSRFYAGLGPQIPGPYQPAKYDFFDVPSGAAPPWEFYNSFADAQGSHYTVSNGFTFSISAEAAANAVQAAHLFELNNTHYNAYTGLVCSNFATFVLRAAGANVPQSGFLPFDNSTIPAKLFAQLRLAGLVEDYAFIGGGQDSPREMPRCFVAGTPIRLADGAEKPIEEIAAGDMVWSYDPEAQDGLGPMKPARVRRTFQNLTRVIIELHGLSMTPGHVCLSDQGEWLSVSNILRHDRAMVRDMGGQAVTFRARTGAYLGSLGDAIINTSFVDPRTGVVRRAEVRAGATAGVKPVGGSPLQVFEPIPLAQIMIDLGRIDVEQWEATRQLKAADCSPLGLVEWPEGSTPFTYDDAGNWVVSLDGRPFTPNWIVGIPRDGEETRAIVNAGGGADDLLIISPYGARTARSGPSGEPPRGPTSARGLPPMRPSLVSSAPTQASPQNRAARRRMASLQRVK